MDIDDEIPALINEEYIDGNDIEAVHGIADSSDTDDDGDDEIATDEEPTICLFCDNTFESINLAFKHIDEKHEVNFIDLQNKFHMDQYSFIKLINYIRLEKIQADKIRSAQHAFWNDDKYLKPQQYETWLCYDYEAMSTKNSEDENNTCPTTASDLQLVINKLQQQVKEQHLLLEQANEDMTTMRSSFQRLLAKDSSVNQPTSEEKVNCVAERSLERDDSYFSSYAHFGIHHEMLSDVVRTTSYRDALLKNKDFIKGKDVLDVGCGTSVLSIFASQAGAKKVVGIDNSDIIYNAMDIVKQNNVQNVSLIKGRLEDTELPQEKFDIIISEWMGYFLLFEGMLDSIIYARDKHLKEDGILMPNRCTMSLLGYGNDELYDKHIQFWHNVYGLDMSNMRDKVLHEPLIDIVDPEYILTETEIIADLNIAKVDLHYSDFTYNFNLKCKKPGKLTAFVGYFDTYFDLPTPVMFSTAPTDKPTHWKQVVFFIEQPHSLESGDVVNGKLLCRRFRGNARSLDIVIEVFGKRCTYYLD